MTHAEKFVIYSLLAATGLLSGGACWGTWKLHHALQGFRQQLFGYRDNLD